MTRTTDSPRVARSRRRAKGWLITAAVVLLLVVAFFLVARSPAPDVLRGGGNGAGVGAGNGVGNGASGTSAGTQGPGTPGVPGTAATAEIATRCPWLQAAMDRHLSAAALARLVAGRMTLAEKLGEIVLVESGEFENMNAGVPRLCIPALTLQDGPQGVAFGAVDVTQLPSPLGLAATFDPSLARSYGQVQGSEAAGQGIDVIQGPTLNVERVPESGRDYEGFGEDPLLVADIGVADIEGIQSTGTMAMAKHFAVYGQETDRGALDDVVSERALQEIYFPPFKAAVTRAHVSTVMCAYPKLNGTYQCQDPQLLSVLAQWGFTGLVRSDLGSVHDPIAALGAGTDMIKPERVRTLAQLVAEHQLPTASVDAATVTVLTQMFTAGLVGQPGGGSPDTDVATDAHTDFALQVAERSAVLLQNQGRVLPLSPSPDRSLAVIGADASTAPVTTGYGSSRVVAPFVSTPLQAIRQRVGSGARITYVNGGSTTRNLPAVPTSLLTPASGGAHGLTLTLTRTDSDSGAAQSIEMVEPTADLQLSPHPAIKPRLGGSASLPPVERSTHAISLGRGGLSLGAATSPTRTRVILPAGWTDAAATFTGTLTPLRTGLYTVSLQGPGTASLSLDGAPAVSDPLAHGLGRWSQTVSLTAGRHYRVHLAWEPIDKTTPSGESTVVPGTFTLGWQYVSGQIAAAARAAASAHTAVVFAGDFNSESFDRPSLSLPGDENALIDAVASANPRTVVVLNTGGPVLMPWLHRVAAVVEGWYPGEQDGASIAALLFGDVDPAGRLPITFPADQAASPIDTAAQWPGVALTSTYSEGLDIGYRYDHATGVRPLFPFGFGLSYTRFTLSHLRRHADVGGGVSLTVAVTNTGRRAGIAVPEAYVTQPAAADEPPAQLAAFASVAVAPGRTRTVTMSIPSTAFAAYLQGGWTTVPGNYTVAVGQSSSDLPLSFTLPAPSSAP